MGGSSAHSSLISFTPLTSLGKKDFVGTELKILIDIPFMSVPVPENRQTDKRAFAHRNTQTDMGMHIHSFTINHSSSLPFLSL